MQPIGHIAGIFRYPVKSMAAQSLERAEVGWHGVKDDRRYAFRRVAAMNGFPWLSATRLPELIRFRPHCEEGADLSIAGNVRVTTPEGETLTLDDTRLSRRVAEAFGQDVELMQLDRGTFDEAPISLISTATIAAVAADVGGTVDVRRFRPNVVVELTAGAPAEDGWLGETIACGEADAPVVVITQRDARCAMINLNPDTGASDPRVLKSVVRMRDNFAGVYGVVIRPGALRLGAPLFLQPAARAATAPTRGAS